MMSWSQELTGQKFRGAKKLRLQIRPTAKRFSSTSEYTDQYITDSTNHGSARFILLFNVLSIIFRSFIPIYLVSILPIYLQAAAARCRIKLNDASVRF